MSSQHFPQLETTLDTSIFSEAGEPGGPFVEMHPDTWPVVEVGRYDMRGPHGRGGAGVVLRVFDRRLGRELALKVLMARGPAALARFAREASITASLQHPSIVPIFDVGRFLDGSPCYTMPLYTGRSLRDGIAAARGLGERLSLLRHLLAVTEAMAHAHARGVLHRDLKPSNVLLGSLGEAVVIDWGLAKAPGRADAEVAEAAADDVVDGTRVGTVMGTPGYMAPEQARGEPVDARADVYSLGAILYDVVVGQPPHVGTSSDEILARVRSEEPVDVQEAAPEVAEDLAALVRKALARERSARYADAGALAEDLRRFMDGRLVEAHEYTRAARLRRWLRRHRSVTYLGAVALAALAVVGALGVVRVRAQRRAALAAAAEASARANALTLAQARGALPVDPTQTLAWLKTYPDEGADWARVRAIADEAAQTGVSQAMLYRNTSSGAGVGARPGGRLLGRDGEAVREWDLNSGRSRSRCLPEPIEAIDSDSLDRDWLAYLGAGGEIVAWQPESEARDLVDLVPGASAAAISADSRWLVAGDGAGEVRVYDRLHGGLWPLTWTGEPVAELQLRRGGDRLAMLVGAHVELWDASRGVPLVITAPGVLDYRVDADGRRLLVRSEAGVLWRDVDAGAVAFVAAKSEYGMMSMAFLPDGRVAFADKARGTVVWNPVSHEERPYPRLLPGALAVSSDGRWLASAALADGVIRVVDLHNGDLIVLRGHAGAHVLALRFLPGNRELLSTEERGTRVWSLDHFRGRIWSFDTSNRRRPEIAVSPDRRVIVASGPDGKLWRRELPEGEPRLVGTNPRRVARMVFEADGEHVLVADWAGELSRWSLRDGARQLIARGLPVITDLVLLPGGTRAMAASVHASMLVVIELRGGATRTLASGRGDFVTPLVSPDGRYVAFGGSPDGVHDSGVLELATDRVRPLEHSGADLRVLGFSPSSRYLFAGTPQGALVRFDLMSGARVEQRVLREQADSGIALTDDLFVVCDGTFRSQLRVWSPSLRLAVPIEEPGMGGGLFPSPSGRRLVSERSDNDTLVVWEPLTGGRYSLVGHDGDMVQVAWLDEQSLVSSARDGTVRFWRLPDDGPRTPTSTRAWMESLSRVRLGDGDAREPDCR